MTKEVETITDVTEEQSTVTSLIISEEDPSVNAQEKQKQKDRDYLVAMLSNLANHYLKQPHLSEDQKSEIATACAEQAAVIANKKY